ncbi:UNVERIFIED_CONTAM: hypothetical protein FKN15_059199 [Acipenser sinensis]
MMYWIVFALYTVLETITDLTVSWFPLYYELKIAFVIWLLSPYTRGASLLYRKFLHPLLSSREREIDDYIVQARERSYETMGQGALTDRLRSFSMHDLTAIQRDEPMQQPFPGLPDHRKKTKISNFEASDYDYSFNQDTGEEISDKEIEGACSEDEALAQRDYDYSFNQDTGEEISDKEIEGACSEDEALAQRGVRRSQSVKMTRLRARKDGQGALTDRLRSFSMHDLTAIQGDEPMQRPFPGLPDPRKKTKISNFEASDYDYSFNQDTGEEISDKEIEGACSEDEALAQRGVRRSQSVKMTRLRARKDVYDFERKCDLKFKEAQCLWEEQLNRIYH